MPDLASAIQAALAERFGERLEIDADLQGLEEITRIAAHRVHRHYLPRSVSPELVRLLCACALSAPSKSDLQQADILLVRKKENIYAIADLLPEMPWLREAPVFLFFLSQWSPAGKNFHEARKTISKRPSRSVLQCND